MSLFLISFFVIYGAMHFYALSKARAAFVMNWPGTLCIAVIMLLFTMVPVLVRIVEDRGFESEARFIAYTGYTWMGAIFLFVSAALLVDLYRVVIRYALPLFGRDLAAMAPSPLISFLVPLAAALILVVYGHFEANTIRTERITIKSPKLPASAGKITVVQISDVHVGLIVREDRLRRILEAVKRAGPDLLISTGDLVDGQINHLNGLSDLFLEINPRFGKYAIAGNHEFFAGITQAFDFTRRTGFVLLRQQSVPVADSIVIAGVDDTVSERFGAKRTVTDRELLVGLPADRFVIFLKHRPEVEEGTDGLFDLQLSGHTHGGQIFPFNLVTRWVYPLHTGRFELKGGSTLYVNRGSGTWGPPIRVFSLPEVTIIELLPYQ